MLKNSVHGYNWLKVTCLALILVYTRMVIYILAVEVAKEIPTPLVLHRHEY